MPQATSDHEEISRHHLHVRTLELQSEVSVDQIEALIIIVDVPAVPAQRLDEFDRGAIEDGEFGDPCRNPGFGEIYRGNAKGVFHRRK
jgi:hypothetical protein